MDIFPLPIFPQGSLRESVITTVWIGVIVISLFNLRFGWTYSGLVIPGYLVPLLLSNPVSALITILEGVLAYGLVRLISEHLSHLGGWCNFFGRDRFFALFLSSVAIRVFMDGWILPQISNWLQNQWNLAFDYQSSFHSFGMIIIALIANQFWKTGLWRGLMPFTLILGTTYFLTRYVLMEFTNFNVGSVAYMYSDTAASLLASPKSYIILIVTGFLASRMNLMYGWEFNGILIPALLALQWYEPLKILSSFIEAGVVFLVSDFLLKLPGLRDITMEGARKVLLFFNVAYAYRFILGYLIPVIAPGVVVTDYYGFAYLLSSLIALKMHGKHIVVRLTRTTLQTSFVAAMIANLVGLSLASVFGSFSLGGLKMESLPVEPLTSSRQTAAELIGQEKIRLFQKRIPESVQVPLPPELNAFHESLQWLKAYIETRGDEALVQARRQLARLNYQVELVEDRYLCLREKQPSRGWGVYLLNLENPRGLLMEVPAPLEEWAVMEGAMALFERLDCHALAIAGGARQANKDGSSDALLNPNLPFQTFHKVFARRNVVQVRGYTTDSLNRMRQSQPEFARTIGVQPATTLWVKSELPPSLSLNALKGFVQDLDVIWKPTPFPNTQQRATRAGFAELWLSRDARIALRLCQFPEATTTRTLPSLAYPESLTEWLLSQKEDIARAGSSAYVPPRPEALLFMDEEILTPLLDILHREYRNGNLTASGTNLIWSINVAAQLLGYQLAFCPDRRLNQDFLVLAERPDMPGRRYWGTFVFRLGEARPFQVQVPRPLFDLNTLEYGVHLFDQLKAEAILVAGAHHWANQDGSADLGNFKNSANMLNLVSQVYLRQAGEAAKMVIQCRGYALLPATNRPPDILLAFQSGISHERMLTPLARELFELLRKEQMQLQFVDGSDSTAGYEISRVPQALYLNQTVNKEFCVAWLSPLLRKVFRPQQEDLILPVHLRTLQVPATEAQLEAYLQPKLGVTRITRLPEALKQTLNVYLKTGDFIALQNAVRSWPAYRFTGVWDSDTRQCFLAIAEDNARPVVLNLNPHPGIEPVKPQDTTSDEEKVRRYLASRAAWLEWVE
jgi:hypothetical protein